MMASEPRSCDLGNQVGTINIGHDPTCFDSRSKGHNCLRAYGSETCEYVPGRYTNTLTRFEKAKGESSLCKVIMTHCKHRVRGYRTSWVTKV